MHQEEVQDGAHPKWVLEPPHLQAAHQPEEVGHGGEQSTAVFYRLLEEGHHGYLRVGTVPGGVGAVSKLRCVEGKLNVVCANVCTSMQCRHRS